MHPIGFYQYILYFVYLESIQKINKYRNNPIIDTEKAIKNWMSQASPRIKKLDEKKTKSIDNSNIAI